MSVRRPAVVEKNVAAKSLKAQQGPPNENHDAIFALEYILPPPTNSVQTITGSNTFRPERSMTSLMTRLSVITRRPAFEIADNGQGRILPNLSASAYQRYLAMRGSSGLLRLGLPDIYRSGVTDIPGAKPAPQKRLVGKCRFCSNQLACAPHKEPRSMPRQNPDRS